MLVYVSKGFRLNQQLTNFGIAGAAEVSCIDYRTTGYSNTGIPHRNQRKMKLPLYPIDRRNGMSNEAVTLRPYQRAAGYRLTITTSVQTRDSLSPEFLSCIPTIEIFFHFLG